jgi:hypothetical protein
MNTTPKRILGILVGGMLLCLGIVVLGLVLFIATTRSVISGVQAEPGEAAAVAAEIADFSLPAGYSSAVVTQIADLEVVGYNGPDGNSHIYLLQLPPAIRVDQAALESQLQSNAPDPGNDYGPNMQVIDQQPVTIRGQAATLVVSEGTNGQGHSIRSANAVFEGKDGQALLSISGRTATWDAALIETFISSMK